MADKDASQELLEITKRLHELEAEKYELTRRRIELQSVCLHPPERVKSKSAGVGGYAGYWTENYCQLCGKSWESNHWA